MDFMDPHGLDVLFWMGIDSWVARDLLILWSFMDDSMNSIYVLMGSSTRFRWILVDYGFYGWILWVGSRDIIDSMDGFCASFCILKYSRA